MTVSTFSTKDIAFDTMKDIEIGVHVKDRPYGRRFTLTFNNTTSDHILFNDIFKKTQKLFLNDSNVDNLHSAQSFLDKLKKAEEDAIADYKTMGKGYKILTCICRFFNFRSHNHLDDIKNLGKDIQIILDNLDFDTNMVKTQDPWDQETKRADLTRKYLRTNNLELASKVIESTIVKDPLLKELAEAYIEKDDLAKALEEASKIEDQRINNPCCEKISRLHLAKGDLFEAVLATGGMKGSSHERNMLLMDIGKGYIAQNNMADAYLVATNIRPFYSDGDKEVEAFLSQVGR